MNRKQINMVWYQEPNFYINIGFLIAGIAYGLYQYIKNKKVTPLYKIAKLLLESLKDGVITQAEWTKINEAVAETLTGNKPEIVVSLTPTEHQIVLDSNPFKEIIDTGKEIVKEIFKEEPDEPKI